MNMTDILSWDLDLFLRLLVASGLGAVIGLERDMHGRPAGLRTHLLVCMGAALFTILSVAVANTLGAGGQTWDPGRIAAQIVTGIGFLGAGAILKAGFSVRGLTTASSLWIAAAIGMASGAGRYDLAGAATLLALISLAGQSLLVLGTYLVWKLLAGEEASVALSFAFVPLSHLANAVPISLGGLGVGEGALDRLFGPGALVKPVVAGFQTRVVAANDHPFELRYYCRVVPTVRMSLSIGVITGTFVVKREWIGEEEVEEDEDGEMLRCFGVMPCFVAIENA